MPRTQEEYKALRSIFSPSTNGIPVNFIFLCESPPQSGSYFYDIVSLRYEFLFRAMMKLIGFNFNGRLTSSIKENGLRTLQSCGCIIVDSIYTPVDGLKDRIADNLILENYPNLISDLQKHSSHTTKIIIVKSTLYTILHNRLIKDKFNVINDNISVPFPSTGQQKRFHNAINKIKHQNNIASFCL